MKKTFAFFAAFLLVVSFGYGQIRVAPVAGPSFTFGLTAGKAKKTMKETERELEEDNPGVSYKNVIGVTPGFLLGGLVDYTFKESLALQSGLLFHLRGRDQTVKAKGTDQFGDVIDNKGTYDYRISYLEVPVWVNYKLSESGFRLIGGLNFGFAVSAKLTAKGKGTSGDLSESTKVSIGNDVFINTVRPLDVSLNLGIGKEFLIGNNPLELTAFVQPSLSKWNTGAKLSPDHWYRYFSTGIRAAYYLSIR